MCLRLPANTGYIRVEDAEEKGSQHTEDTDDRHDDGLRLSDLFDRFMAPVMSLASGCLEDEEAVKRVG